MDESHFVNKCQNMSYEELGAHIEICLNNLKKDKTTTENIPKDEKTYAALIELLENTFIGDFKQAKERKKKINEELESLEENVSSELSNQLIERERQFKKNEAEKETNKYLFKIQILSRKLLDLKQDPYLLRNNKLLDEFFKLWDSKKGERKRIRKMELRDRVIFIEKVIETQIKSLEEKLLPFQKKKEYFSTVSEEILKDFIIEKLNNDIRNLDKWLGSKSIAIEHDAEISKKLRYTISLRSKKREVFGDSYLGVPVKKLSWKFFPKGEWTVEAIIKEFSKYVSHDERIDEKRLRRIVDDLKPSYCYIGAEKFNRYIAFCFEGKDKVILECPIYGNAIYVIKGDWKEITKLHKWEARQSSKVTVIRHNETWFSRLQSNISSRY